uniref:Hyccin n=1 Tax=Setaria italica TaxID=4555 RepID=K3ZET5_SETIT
MPNDVPPQPIHSAKDALDALAGILGGALPGSIATADDPADTLLNDPDVASAVTGRLRGAGSGAGNDTLCRWLYDAFRANVPELQLAVLRFVPTLAGVYMCRAVSRKPLAGFEAVLLALYAHAVAQRGGAGEAETVSLPNLANPSPYHDAKAKPAELDVAVLSPPLEPHGTMRATRRARIVGAVLELYHGKLSRMPLSSKMDFCEFCVAWAGTHNKADDDDKPRLPPATDAVTGAEKWRRVPLPWELFQPVVRIVAHCLLGPSRSDELKAQAARAAECLYWRATETMDAPALLATRSLMRLSQMVEEPIPEPSFSGAIENMAELEAMRANILNTKN